MYIKQTLVASDKLIELDNIYENSVYI